MSLIKKREWDWKDWATLKPIFASIKGQNQDTLDIKHLSDIVRAMRSEWAWFIEYLQKTGENPQTLTDKALGMQELSIYLAIPMAYPDLNFIPDEAFKNLLLLLVADMSPDLKGEKEEVNDKAIELAGNISTLIRNRRSKVFAQIAPNIKIGDIEISSVKIVSKCHFCQLEKEDLKEFDDNGKTLDGQILKVQVCKEKVCRDKVSKVFKKKK